MAVTVVGNNPLTFNTALTLQLVSGLPPAGCGAVLRICAPAGADVFYVQDNASVDGGAAPTNYSRIPAGLVDRVPLRSAPLLIAGSAVGAATIQVEPGGPLA